MRLGLKPENGIAYLNLINHNGENQIFNLTQKKEQKQKNNDKDGKTLYKLMNNAIYRKRMENLRNRINVKLVSNEKGNLKFTSKPSYFLHKILGSNLVIKV